MEKNYNCNIKYYIFEEYETNLNNNSHTFKVYNINYTEVNNLPFTNSIVQIFAQ